MLKARTFLCALGLMLVMGLLFRRTAARRLLQRQVAQLPQRHLPTVQLVSVLLLLARTSRTRSLPLAIKCSRSPNRLSALR